MYHIANRKTFPGHSMIYRQGDPGDGCFIILSGKVRVFRRGLSGSETVLSLLGSGDGFGEMALIAGERRSESAETLEETHLLVIGRPQLDRILKNDPNVTLALINQMSTWLIRNEQIIENEAERQLKAPKFSWLDFLFILVISILCGLIFNFSIPNRINIVPGFWSDKMVPDVALQIALAKHSEGALFVDARPSIFYEQGHIKGAVNVPSALFDIMYMMELSEVDKNKNIIVYGRTISSHYDEQVARKLVIRGHRNIMILKGGLSAWKKKGYPI